MNEAQNNVLYALRMAKGDFDKARKLVQTTAEVLAVPAGHAEMILADMNGANAEGRKLAVHEVEAKWGVERERLDKLKEIVGGDVTIWRKGLAVKAAANLSLIQDELFKKLSDPEEVAKMTVEQLTRAAKSMTDAFIVNVDGNAPTGGGSISDLMAAMTRLQEMKPVRTVDAG